MSLKTIACIFALCYCYTGETVAKSYGPSCPAKATGEAILNTFVLGIDLNDPSGDLTARVSHGDLRPYCMREIVLTFPGFTETDSELLWGYVDALGCRVVEGSSDSVDSMEHAELLIQFGSYATDYNVALKRHLNRCLVDNLNNGHRP